MNPLDWRDQPPTAQIGPACRQSRMVGVLTAIFIRPVLGVLTLIGLLINRVRPDLLRARVSM